MLPHPTHTHKQELISRSDGDTEKSGASMLRAVPLCIPPSWLSRSQRTWRGVSPPVHLSALLLAPLAAAAPCEAALFDGHPAGGDKSVTRCAPAPRPRPRLQRWTARRCR